LSPPPRLTVAIATYNGRHLLATLLPSLAAQTFRDHHVVVVDDASSDGTPDWLKENWPEVEVIVHGVNRGVTVTLNDCLRSAHSELVALINNDIELDRNCLAELVSALDAHPDAGSAAAKLVDFYDRGLLDGTGDVYEWSGEANRRGHGERDVGQYEREQPVFGACGGAAIYRRSALETVGLLDEDFFAYYEDVDWSFRALLLGYSSWYAPRAIAYHIGGATLGNDVSDFMLYQARRNALFVVLKNYPLPALLRRGHTLALALAHHLVWAMQTDRVGVTLRAWRDALRAVPTLLRKRRQIQRGRVVRTEDLEKVIGAQV
jgi:GT2 family glycosyltransferase